MCHWDSAEQKLAEVVAGRFVAFAALEMPEHSDRVQKMSSVAGSEGAEMQRLMHRLEEQVQVSEHAGSRLAEVPLALGERLGQG